MPAIDAAVRNEVRALPVDEAYIALTREDPARAAALSPNDAARISRALEVVRSSGRPLVEWQAERVGGIADQVTLSPLILLPDRPTLYARCDLRFGRMLSEGAVEEVATLIARELDPALPVMRAIGVPEIAGFLRDEWTLQEAQSRGAQATRNYAKRQYTWFRRQPPDDWPRSETHDFNIQSQFAFLFHT